MVITNSSKEDIPEIFRLYKLATGFQKIKFPGNQWPEFDPELIANEVVENRQFKLLIDNKVACVWAITYSDPILWENDDALSSIYIHRIATNPSFRGNNFVKVIVDWAKKFTMEENKKNIRMDTCGMNEKLISHYKKCGFQFLGMRKLQNAKGLPSHYHNADVCYFEIELK